MSIGEPAAVIHRLVEAFWGAGDPAAYDRVFAADFVDHTPHPPGAAATPRETLLALQAAFADVRTTIDDLLVQGDKVAWRWTFHGTHTGQALGAPPTGRRVVFSGITIDRIAGDRIVERWSQIDVLGLLRQLGGPGPTDGTAGEPGRPASGA